MRRGGRPWLGLLAAALLATGCSSGSSDDPGASAPGSTSPTRDSAALSCAGTGAPTIVLEPGLDTGGGTFSLLSLGLQKHHRVCSHTRPGTGTRAPSDGSASTEQGAQDLAEVLTAAGESPPYVLVGWSYGGIVVRAFARDHPDQVAGMVLEDSSEPEQLADPAFGLAHLRDGGRPVDLEATAASVRGLSLRDVPLIALSSDELSGSLRTKWYAYHQAQAALSSQGQHVRAVGSGHAIHEDATALERTAIEAVATAAGTGEPLPDCGRIFTGGHARCLG